jgi:glutamyl-tRNA reductase
MYNQFRSVSLSYQCAPLDIREKITLNEEEAKALMLRFKDFFALTDLMMVSTCNRTEVYYSAENNINEEIIRLLLIEKGLPQTDEVIQYFTKLDNSMDAARHLFEVATGLHSQVVGDMQIPNQIKKSYQWSADLNLAGPYLHRLMHSIFFANKKVAQETSFRDGAASVSYAAVELVEHLVINPKILVVGLGEIGTDVCKNLADKGIEDITLINRTRSKSEELAQEYGFKVADIVNLETEVSRADVIISSVSLPEPYFTKERVNQLTDGLTFKYFIDLSVPRSVDPSVEEIPGVMVYNIDAIQLRADEALNRRLQAIPDVHAIITHTLEEFNDWSKEMVVSPTIQKLKNTLEQIRQEEMARYMKSLTQEEASKVDRITSGIMQKVLKLPVLQLKAACKRGEAETLIDVLNDLFNLEKQADSPENDHSIFHVK